ncbi:PAS domain S-box protein, partial [Chloroflexota bacterium]
KDSFGNPQEFIAITKDISGRKRAEQALRESEERQLRIFESINDGIALTDLNGFIFEVNEKAVSMGGYHSKEELLGKNALKTIADCERDRALADMQALLKEGVTGSAEYRLIKTDGSEYPAEISASLLMDTAGNPIGFISVIRDITERKQAEEALWQSEKKYKTLFESKLDGVVVFDETMKLLIANKATADIFGFDSVEELLEVNMIDFIVPEERERVLKIIREDMFENDLQKVNEFQLKKKSGEEIWVSAVGTLTEYDGKIVGLGSFRDITQQKRAMEQLNEYHKELRSLALQLSLAEERERRRIAIEVHDRLSQTIAVCRMKLGTLVQSATSVDMAESLNEIKTVAEKLIDDTHSLTFELSSPLLYDFGLEAAVEQLTEQFEEQHGIEFSYEDDGESKPLDDDIRVLLFQTVRELLVNIAKHARAQSAKVCISRDDGHLCITVEDDGIGFNASNMGTSWRRVKGFGLFSIRERLHYIDGYIEIKSEPGHGTRVAVVVPLKQE